MYRYPKLSSVLAPARVFFFFFFFTLLIARSFVVEGTLVNGRKILIETKEKQRLLIAEDCFLPETCVDEENDFIACFRKPENESMGQLFLLLQNKGTKPVTVTLAVPGFVEIDQTMVQLQPNYSKQVMITPGYDGVDSLIILTTDEGRRCSLDFRDPMFLHSNISTDHNIATNEAALYLKNTTDAASDLDHQKISIRTHHFLGFVSLIVLLILAFALICGCGCGFALRTMRMDQFRRNPGYVMVN